MSGPVSNTHTHAIVWAVTLSFSYRHFTIKPIRINILLVCDFFTGKDSNWTPSWTPRKRRWTSLMYSPPELGVGDRRWLSAGSVSRCQELRPPTLLPTYLTVMASPTCSASARERTVPSATAAAPGNQGLGACPVLQARLTDYRKTARVYKGHKVIAGRREFTGRIRIRLLATSGSEPAVWQWEKARRQHVVRRRRKRPGETHSNFRRTTKG